ncbi:MAG: lysophospholipid acyltransferase family protein [bacterium]|nr:lysophospholipid acyltransferase family protein [bacterium]
MRLLARAYRAGARLTRACPPGPRYGVASATTAAVYRVLPGRWAAARRNYAAVLDRQPDDPEVGAMVHRAVASYGEMLADFMLVGDLSPDRVEEMVSADGLEHVDTALAGGKGAILALPHMGSWDMAGALGGVWRYPVLAVAERMPGSLDEEVVSSRSRHGVRIVPLGRSAVREIFRALDTGSLIALLCDLPHGPGMIEVELFGRRAMVPSGPAAIACRRACPILPGFVRRIAPARYHIHVDPPLDLPPGKGRQAEAKLMRAVLERFEGFIREYPDQWYAFRPILS